jgi:hypothetical protein
MGKVAIVALAATVTLPVWPPVPAGGGNTALGSLLARLTAIPPGGAAPERVTVPVSEFPPITGDALKVMLVTVSADTGVTLTMAVSEGGVEPDRLAVSVTFAVAAGVPAVTVKFTEVEPAGTVTLLPGRGNAVASLVVI